MEGQHQTPLQLIHTNMKTILTDILNKLECQDFENMDYIRYRVDWLCAMLLRLGERLEESLLPFIQQAQFLLSSLEGGIYCTAKCTPPLIKTGLRGRPKFQLTLEQLEYFLEYGFKARDMAQMLNVSEKTIARRLSENGISVRETY